MIGFAVLVTSLSAIVGTVAASASIQGETASTCLVPHGAGPGYNASIGNEQNDESVCITIGEKLLVLLSAASPNASPWQEVRVSTPGILKTAPLTIMFARGLTGTNFQAVHSGTVRLTSQRPACGPTTTGSPVCDAIEEWQATVIVRRSVGVPSNTGVYGTVTAGPTCPVERVGQPCPPRPVMGEVELRDTSGATVGSTRTASDGRYALRARPGTYTLVVDTGSTFPRCPSKSVTVVTGERLLADISCDTGIR